MNFLGGNSRTTFKSCLVNVWGGKITDATEGRVCVRLCYVALGMSVTAEATGTCDFNTVLNTLHRQWVI